MFQPYPTVRGKCFEKAMRRSFFSRDNMENFIKFCRSLGVHENLLFESDDLGMYYKIFYSSWIWCYQLIRSYYIIMTGCDYQGYKLSKNELFCIYFWHVWKAKQLLDYNKYYKLKC